MSTLARLVSRLYIFRRSLASEEVFLRRTLKARVAKGARLLDVGCGFSRFHEIIRDCGVEYAGVDVNPETVARNRQQGRTVFLESEFVARTSEPYDVLLLSHIIEHFAPLPLVAFLNSYLTRLREGGLVVIFTPLLHRGFYDDFDHIKPYNPAAVRQLFCRSSGQTQPYGLAGDYAELALWFKRDSLWHSHRVGRWRHLFALPLVLASTLSLGAFGKLTGYGMVLRKLRT